MLAFEIDDVVYIQVKRSHLDKYDFELAEVDGMNGRIRGYPSLDEVSPGARISYAVWVYETETLWSIDEIHLEATGLKDTTPVYVDSVRVYVDPESGEGWLAESQNRDDNDQ